MSPRRNSCGIEWKEELTTALAAAAAGGFGTLVLMPNTAQWIVCGKAFASKGKYTPLEGKVLTGKVLVTYHRGREVFKSE